MWSDCHLWQTLSNPCMCIAALMQASEVARWTRADYGHSNHCQKPVCHGWTMRPSQDASQAPVTGVCRRAEYGAADMRRTLGRVPSLYG